LTDSLCRLSSAGCPPGARVARGAPA
jgi:hypothetical protein